jgi:hypothetical protein
MHQRPPLKRAIRVQFQRPMKMSRDEKVTVYTNAQILKEAKDLMDRLVARGGATRPKMLIEKGEHK